MNTFATWGFVREAFLALVGLKARLFAVYQGIFLLFDLIKKCQDTEKNIEKTVNNIVKSNWE